MAGKTTTTTTTTTNTTTTTMEQTHTGKALKEVIEWTRPQDTTTHAAVRAAAKTVVSSPFVTTLAIATVAEDKFRTWLQPTK